MPKIKDIRAIEILDSRGNPTVRAFCKLEEDAETEASVPSGASTGVHEALELRDGDPNRYGGKGVLKAVANVNEEIREHLLGREFSQKELDDALISLDGTENKSRLGANAILGVSLAFARASAASLKKELFEYIGEISGNNSFSLPTPMLNVINGGKHADSGLDIQEFMLVPAGFQSFKEKIRAGEETFQALKKILEEKKYTVSVGDEGGFAPKLPQNEEALALLEEAKKKAGYGGEKIKLSLDAAASTFYKDGKYKLKIAGKTLEADISALTEWYEKLCAEYPIFSIEDPVAEDDWQGFTSITTALGRKIKIVGDDLTVTSLKRIREAEKKKAINAVLIKLNQIGTLSETLEAIREVRDAGWTVIVSHRSGETEDSFIADLAVGVSAPYIKSGAPDRAERTAKYDRLLEIEETISAG